MIRLTDNELETLGMAMLQSDNPDTSKLIDALLVDEQEKYEIAKLTGYNGSFEDYLDVREVTGSYFGDSQDKYI